MTLDEFQYANPIPDLRTELVDGRLLVREPPRLRHGSVSTNVVIALSRYFDCTVPQGAPRGLLASNDAGVILRRHPDTVRAPDVLYFTAERQPVDLDRYAETAPDLVVEVRSPSDRAGYMQRKVAGWLAFGCQQVWVVDPAQRTLAVHEPDGVTSLSASDHLTGGALFPGFTVPVATLFP
jgi:Uma2 family endonuclease